MTLRPFFFTAAYGTVALNSIMLKTHETVLVCIFIFVVVLIFTLCLCIKCTPVAPVRQGGHRCQQCPISTRNDDIDEGIDMNYYY